MNLPSQLNPDLWSALRKAALRRVLLLGFLSALGILFAHAIPAAAQVVAPTNSTTLTTGPHMSSTSRRIIVMETLNRSPQYSLRIRCEYCGESSVFIFSCLYLKKGVAGAK